MPTMPSPTEEHAAPPLAPPSRAKALWFWFRIRCLTLQRIAQDAINPQLGRWPHAAADDTLAVLAEQRSALWTDGRADEFLLVAGKVHNLRVARQSFHHIAVPANRIFSFWHQLGRATAWRGFVLGREVREGCVTPAIAGGICQLSNALATVAAQAGLHMVERHGHTARIQQATGRSDPLDATVLWKHIDLRLSAPFAWQLDIGMDGEFLTVRIRGQRQTSTSTSTPLSDALVPATVAAPTQMTSSAATHARIAIRPVAPTTAARSCLTCSETTCFRHAPHLAGMANAAATRVALIDALTPELRAHVMAEGNAGPRMRCVLPHSLRGQPPPSEPPVQRADARAKWLAWQRRIWLRWHANSPGQRQASIMRSQLWQAQNAARALRPTDVEVLVDQAYLPSLPLQGALAGRRLAVWMTALPMQHIMQTLDRASAQWPDEPSLADFRADAQAAQAEMQALNAAHTIVTAHHAVANWARSTLHAKVIELPWKRPEIDHPSAAVHPSSDAPLIVLLASALPRKGSRELAAALQLLNANGHAFRVGVLGSLPDASALAHWAGLAPIALDHHSAWWQHARVAVLPAHVAHVPRAALVALAAGIPVVATPACGLPPQAGLSLIGAGDVSALHSALNTVLHTAS